MTAVSLYAGRDSRLHRWHPLTKLALVFFCLVVGLVLPGLWGSYAVFAALILPVAALGRIAGRLAGSTWRAVLPFAISLFLIQGLFWTAGTPVLALGPLSLKREGLLFAIVSTGRILLIVSSFLLLTISTRPDALILALSQRGLPGSIAYILLTTLQIIPRFQVRANTILDAQRSRGLETEGRLLQRLQALLPLVQPLILGSIIDIEERAIALEARAFGRRGPRTSLLVLTDSSRQQAARWVLVATAVLALVARFTVGR